MYTRNINYITIILLYQLYIRTYICYNGSFCIKIWSLSPYWQWNLLRTCSSRPLIRQIPLELPGSERKKWNICSVVPSFNRDPTGLVTGFHWIPRGFLWSRPEVQMRRVEEGMWRPEPWWIWWIWWSEKPEDAKGQDSKINHQQLIAAASKSKIENTFLETQRTSDTQEAALLDAKASWNRYHSWAATLDVHKVNGIGYDHDRIHYPPQCKHRPRDTTSI